MNNKWCDEFDVRSSSLAHWLMELQMNSRRCKYFNSPPLTTMTMSCRVCYVRQCCGIKVNSKLQGKTRSLPFLHQTLLKAWSCGVIKYWDCKWLIYWYMHDHNIYQLFHQHRYLTFILFVDRKNLQWNVSTSSPRQVNIESSINSSINSEMPQKLILLV